ncbi:MAG: NADPH-dependent F420 reductase, partial [Gammaproteobacteria bacterium]|nr:NADPH-dependent F420 reductase [Gammaproteobacteria bacterium]
TGALGNGLARRWAAAGYPVVLGSRSKERAQASARDIPPKAGGPAPAGTDNAAAAALGDIVVITVPFSSHGAILEEIRESVAGKIVVDATVPLVPPKVGTVQLPPAGSAAAMTQETLGDRADVVSAFHNVAAEKLREAGPVDCDVLVCGNKRAARQAVIALVEALGLRGLHAGPIANSAAAEALTSVLITINKHYKVQGAGVRITGELIAPDPDGG